MNTIIRGIFKKHIPCGGQVQYRENLNPDHFAEFISWCLNCDAEVEDEDIKIQKVDK